MGMTFTLAREIVWKSDGLTKEIIKKACITVLCSPKSSTADLAQAGYLIYTVYK
jgi:hypothetical protein